MPPSARSWAPKRFLATGPASPYRRGCHPGSAKIADRSTAEAVDAGVTGTPAWLFAGRYLLPGAQPREVLDRVVTLLRERGVG